MADPPGSLLLPPLIRSWLRVVGTVIPTAETATSFADTR
jgi:hypothetical protein